MQVLPCIFLLGKSNLLPTCMRQIFEIQKVCIRCSENNIRKKLFGNIHGRAVYLGTAQRNHRKNENAQKRNKKTINNHSQLKTSTKTPIYGGANLQHSRILQASQSRVSRKSCPSPQKGNGRGPYEQLLCCPQLFHLTYSRGLTLSPSSALRRQNSFYACRRNKLNFQDLCSDKNHIRFFNYLGILLIYAHENPLNQSVSSRDTVAKQRKRSGEQ